MRNVRVSLVVILVACACQALLLFIALICVYQVRPARNFAGTMLRYAKPVATFARNVEKGFDSLWYQSFRIPEGIPFYSISIPAEELQALDDSLQAVRGPLNEEDRIWLKAKFFYNNKEHDIKVRVRGDMSNHWRYEKKSWRLNFKNDDLFMGMSEFNLIIPEDRAWFGALLNNKRARDMGMVQPPMRFVVVSINGSSPMLYLEVEHWTKEMFERQGKSSNIDLFKEKFANPFTHITNWDIYSDFGDDVINLETADLLLKLARGVLTRSRQDLSQSIDTLFYNDQLSAWYAHSLLAGDGHVVDDNVRLFYDFSRGKFEPIPWDVNLYDPISITDKPKNLLWQTIFSYPERKLRVHTLLWDYLSDAKRVKEDMQFVEDQKRLIESVIFKDKEQYLTHSEIRTDLERRMQQVIDNMQSLATQLQTSAVLVRVLPVSVGQDGQSVMAVEFIVHGPSMALLSGTLHLSEATQLYLDNGDGVLNEQDTLVAIDDAGRVRDMQFALLDPVHSNGMYRYYFVGENSHTSIQEMVNGLTNAVTKMPLILKGVAENSDYLLYATEARDML